MTGSRQFSALMKTMSISTGVSASSGGVQLSQCDSDLSGWQAASGGRARKAAPSSTAMNGSFASSSTNMHYNKTGFAKIKACKPPPAETYNPKPEQPKKAGTSKLRVDLEKMSKCTNSDWDSEEEENGSVATTQVTQSNSEFPEEHEIIWQSDSSSDAESDDE